MFLNKLDVSKPVEMIVLFQIRMWKFWKKNKNKILEFWKFGSVFFSIYLYPILSKVAFKQYQHWGEKMASIEKKNKNMETSEWLLLENTTKNKQYKVIN